MGFSPLGLIVSIAVLAPNLLLLVAPPRTPLPSARVPGALTLLERAGQALCLVVPAITEPGELRWWGFVVVVAALAVYYGLWMRYLVGGRDGAALYRPLWRVPVPMAIAPVVAFLGAAAWLSNPWVAGAAAVLAAGHIPASILIARDATRRPDNSSHDPR